MHVVKIRKAEFSDIGPVLEIEQESISSWNYSQFLQELGNTFSIFLIAEYEGSVAGFITAWKAADEIQINSIAVKKDLRKLGIGKKLLTAIFNFIPADQYSSVYLEVRSRNSEAISFYSENGFTKTGIRKNYYPDDDAILMEKKL